MGLAFDSSGDLWVTKNNFTAVEFTKAQLAKSGSPVPRVTITNTNQCSVVFDSSGDLWEGSFGDVVLDFTKAQLASPGSPTPHVTLTSGSLNMPCRPTFDPVGDMWAANYMGDTLVEFSKADLAKSGSPLHGSPLARTIANPGLVAATSCVAATNWSDLTPQSRAARTLSSSGASAATATTTSAVSNFGRMALASPVK